MKVALIGSGGREHAIAYKISQSPSLEKLYILPGNPGTSLLGENIKIDVSNNNDVLQFCSEKKIDLVVVGPEIPLVNGLPDLLRKNGIPVFGPDAAAAAIEGDKSFAKKLMADYLIPTAAFRTFSSSEYTEALKYINEGSLPVVIKASGLAAGKGVLICSTPEEAEQALKDCFVEKLFGDSGSKIVVEEFMTGQEASLFAVTDGTDFICLPAAQDHKRIWDNDQGKNTGGMGAYAPAPIVTPEILKQVEDTIIAPTLKAMKDEGRTFIGCLYCGLMLTSEGPKVVEFNCRFGDPETQAVLPLIEGDFVELLSSSAKGKLNKSSVSYSGGAAVCVVAASNGYPDKYAKGFEIKGLKEAEAEDIIVFHAGTRKEGDKIVTDGGRVLGVTAVIKHNDLKECQQKAYKALETICFDNIYYRRDIAQKAFSKASGQ